jgi:hypothetical protein
MTRRFASRAHRDSEAQVDPHVTTLPPRADASGGEALDPAVRVAMEPRFGHDFSGVRVHADAEADRLASGFSARAFATGTDLFFRADEYSPATRVGQHLLAHELAHVVQQERFGTPSGPGLSHAHDAAEVEAHTAADAVLAGESAPVQTASSAAIAREDDDKKPDLGPLNDALNDQSPFKQFRPNPFPQQAPDPLDNPRADSQRDWDKWQAEQRGDKYPNPLMDPQPADPKDPHKDPLYLKDWSKPAPPGTPYLYPNPLAPDPTLPPWIKPDVPWLKDAPQDAPIPGPGDFPKPDDDQKYS